MPLVPFELVSPAFKHVEMCSLQNKGVCEVFPKLNVMTTIGGQNQSPELSWGPGPEGTMSYAIVLHDLSNDFTHWAIWNIPATVLKLPANLTRDTKPEMFAPAQQSSFETGYMGPGATNHVYQFRLYAIKSATISPNNDEKSMWSDLEGNEGNVVLKASTLRGLSPN